MLKSGKPLHIVLLLSLTVSLSGCWVKKTMCRGLHNALPDSTCRAFENNGPAPADAAVVSGVGVQSGVGPDVAPAYALARIVPEQLSSDLAQTVAFGEDELHHYEPSIGQTLDYLVLGYGAPLGGLDFTTTQRRDPETKAQTLLVARVVAWQIAAAALWKDHDKDPAARQLFTKCRMETDRPYQPSDSILPADEQAQIRDGETRWRAQVEELFFRFYARPPAAFEYDAVRTAFLLTFNNEGYAPFGWLTVLYALLASQEFWHQ